MWSTLRIAITLAFCSTLLLHTTHASDGGSISIALFADTNCTAPLNNSLFDLHSFHPNPADRYG